MADLGEGPYRTAEIAKRLGRQPSYTSAPRPQCGQSPQSLYRHGTSGAGDSGAGDSGAGGEIAA